MSSIEIKVPDIGDFKDVEVIEILVKPGDTIKPEQSLVTVESDKASMEIPSSAGGVVKEVLVKIGDKINEGTLLVLIESSDAGAGSSPAPVAAASPSAAPVPATASAPAPSAAPGKVASPPSPGGTGPIEVKVPDIGDFKEVEVIEVLVKPGDTIKAEQSLITVESDKASMEIPSSAAGVVKDVKVKVGDKVAEGTVVVILEGAGGAVSPAAPAASSAGVSSGPATEAPPPALSLVPPSGGATRPHPVPAEMQAPEGSAIPHASPSVRKFARELGVELSRVNGTGPKGRIIHEDVQNYVKGAVSQVVGGAAPKGAAAPAGGGGLGLQLLPWPSLDFSKYGETELKKLSRIQKLSGPNLARNWAMIPHVTQFDEADITDLESFRKSTNESMAKQGVKVTMLAFVMKACVSALKKFPAFNSSLDAEGANLILKKYYHLGFAADTPNGLMVPVIRDCDKKGVAEIAAETGALAAKARDGKLGPAEMQGATFTVSSLGGVGGTSFTPIINAPEVAILGLSKSDLKPKWDGKTFAPRLMLPLSLSYDHRVIDGAQAARFSTYLADLLGDMRKVLV